MSDGTGDCDWGYGSGTAGFVYDLFGEFVYESGAQVCGFLPEFDKLDISVSCILYGVCAANGRCFFILVIIIIIATINFIIITEPVLSECRRQLFRSELLDAFGAEPDVLAHA